ncbi:MAG TPA: hypothetical protein VNJ04_19545 [Gemmatimonadaceae bacterium]|nr:hypothetical protein [Gemmatimonadaceae bacterium]
MTGDRRILRLPTTEDDHDEADREHYTIFAHWPEPGPDGKCTNEIHQWVKGIIDQPGVEISIDFVPQEMGSVDEAGVIAQEVAYQKRVDDAHDRIREVEERREHRKARS